MTQSYAINIKTKMVLKFKLAPKKLDKLPNNYGNPKNDSFYCTCVFFVSKPTAEVQRVGRGRRAGVKQLSSLCKLNNN